MAKFPASLLILNGKSIDNLPLHEAVMLSREEGMTIHVQITWEKDNAARFIEGARKLGVATATAGGGDGTVNEVSTALIQYEGDEILTLGILPLGTANDFATGVRIPEVLDKALEPAIAGNAIAIGMARVNKQTCFISMTAGGSGACITTETPERLKAALGGVSCIIHGLMRMNTLQPDRYEVRGEDSYQQDDALVTGISNGHQVGGGQQLCPNALINDGLLQLRIFIGDEIIPTLVSALESDKDNPNIIEGASSRFDIQAPYEITFNLGGEPLGGQSFRIEVLLVALRCRLSPDCPSLH